MQIRRKEEIQVSAMIVYLFTYLFIYLYILFKYLFMHVVLETRMKLEWDSRKLSEGEKVLWIRKQNSNSTF